MTTLNTPRALLILVSFFVMSCSSTKPTLLPAVPELNSRLGPFSLSEVDTALSLAVCLLRGDKARDCRIGIDDQPCVLDSREKVRSRIEPVFRRLPQVRLVSGSAAMDDARQLFADIPGVVPSLNDVTDARRDRACDDWGCNERGDASDQCGRCLAIRVDKLWLLLHSPELSPDGSLDYFEMFLAEPVCVDEID